MLDRPLGFSGPRQALAALSLTGIMLMALIDVFIANIAAPSIGRSLHAGGGALQLVVASYALTYGTVLIVGARLGDRFGRRRIALAGVALFAAASVLCASAQSMAWLVGARLTQGVGAALMAPQVLAIIDDEFVDRDRQLAMGLYGAAIGLGAILGQLLGGALISADWGHLGWRLVFVVNVPIALLVFAGIAATVTERARDAAPAPFDLGGAVLWCLALGGLAAPLLLVRSLGWSALLAAVAALGVAAAVLFVREERKRRRAHLSNGLIDPSIAEYGDLRQALGVLFLLQATLAAFLFVFVLTFQSGLGRSPAQIGYTLVAPGAAFAVVSVLRYRVGDQLRDYTLQGCLVAALAFVALGAFGLLAGAGRFGLLVSLPTLLLCGVGIGLTFAPTADKAIQAVPEALTGTAAGLVATTLQLANVAGVAVFGATFLALRELAGGSPADAAVKGFSETLLVVACVLGAYCLARGARSPRVRMTRTLAESEVEQGGLP